MSDKTTLGEQEVTLDKKSLEFRGVDKQKGLRIGIPIALIAIYQTPNIKNGSA